MPPAELALGAQNVPREKRFFSNLFIYFRCYK